MSKRILSYYIQGEVPQALKEHFDKPGLGFVVGHVTAVFPQDSALLVKMHHLEGHPSFMVKVIQPGELQTRNGVVNLTGVPNDDTYLAEIIMEAKVTQS